MKRNLIIIAVGVLALTACKPTEKNYRSAYDIAVNKRQAEQQALDAEGLVSEDAPKPRYIDGDTLYFANEIIRMDEDFAPYKDAKSKVAAEGTPVENPLKALNVAVGMFKMNTNARSGASDLRDKGFSAFPVRAQGGKWYIIAGSFDTLDSARVFIKDFTRRNPSFPYIGLNGRPVIIRN